MDKKKKEMTEAEKKFPIRGAKQSDGTGMGDARSYIEGKEKIMGNIGLDYGAGSSGMDFVNSMWYSPELMPDVWVLPKSRMEILKWIRFFYNTDPYIYSIINMHSLFPFSMFDIVSSDEKVSEFYYKASFNRDFNLYDLILDMSLAFNKFGEAICMGQPEEISYEGVDIFKFRNFILFEPEVVNIYKSALERKEYYSLLMTAEFKEEIKQLLDRGKEVHPLLTEAIHTNASEVDLDGTYMSKIINRTDPSAVRGTSQIQPLLRTLMFQDKVNMLKITAIDRYRYPLEIWKIGDVANNILPDPAVLQNFEKMIKHAKENPPYALFVPPFVEFSTAGYGAESSLFSYEGDYEWVRDSIMVGLGVNKNLIQGDAPGFCLDDESRILTKDGLKYRKELTLEDEVATFNPDTKNIEYHKPIKKYEFDHDGEMIHFNTRRIDLMVTPNHKCYVKKGHGKEWNVLEAKEIGQRDYMSLDVKWEGKTPTKNISVGDKSMPIEKYLKEQFGKGAYNKRIPKWIKELAPEYLDILLTALIKGDGNERNKNFKDKSKNFYSYYTTSTRLAEDVAEIAMKVGYMPKISKHKDRPIMCICFTDAKKDDNRTVVLETKVKNKQVIKKVNYQGKVWCVEVPNHLFIAERNGCFVITGNSNVKQLSLQKLMMQYSSVRDRFTNWMVNHYFYPIAEANDFVSDTGDLNIPEVVWYKNLDIDKDKVEDYQKLWDKGLISTKTLYSKFNDLDFGQEQELLKDEIGSIYDDQKRIRNRNPNPLGGEEASTEEEGGGDSGSSDEEGPSMEDFDEELGIGIESPSGEGVEVSETPDVEEPDVVEPPTE